MRRPAAIVPRGFIADDSHDHNTANAFTVRASSLGLYPSHGELRGAKEFIQVHMGDVADRLSAYGTEYLRER
ncbi:hypothetical protein EYF80_051762 [Liparis tanakae]|uniref:Uncharacterized protein n=1 Tax=Liparis tanakae TaxID=230148 RepID=A0A4Z2FB85_9TELE|nr:hypothetical protein EYF80_051762 [Liparis tanakae]